MMRFQDLPIKRKLVGLMFLTSMAVLLVAAAAMLAYEFRSYHRDMAARLGAVASIVANNSAAVLGFDDPELGNQILSSLRVQPEVSRAALYDEAGIIYSRFPTNLALGEFPATLADGDRAGFNPDYFTLYMPVTQENHRMGTVYLKADYRQMYQRLEIYGAILWIVLLAAGLLGLFLANLFEGTISKPMLELTNVAKSISRRKDYSLRAVNNSKDELGYLTQAFNSMLSQIQARDSKLQESEKRFREMIDALPTAVYTTDASGRLTHFNPASAELSGRTPSLGTDQWCVSWKLYNADGSPIAHDQWPMALAMKNGHAIRSTELIVERPDGRRAWVSAYPTPLYDGGGQMTGGINMLVDITDRKRAEESMRRSEARYRSIFKGVPVSLWEEDFSGVMSALAELRARGMKDVRRYCADHPEFVQDIKRLIRVRDVNDCTVRMFEARDKEELLGALADVFTADWLPVLIEEIRALAEGESFLQGEAVLRTVQGNPINVLYAMSLPPGTEEYDRVLFSMIDITERKRVELALLDSEQRFRMIADNIPVLAWTADPLGVRTWYNKQWCEYTGLTLEVAQSDGWESLQHPEHRPSGTLQTSFECGEPWEDTFPLRGRDGHVPLVSIPGGADL